MPKDKQEPLNMMDKSLELVIIPSPGKGHLVSTFQFAEHLLRHDHRLSVTVLVIPQSFSESAPLASTFAIDDNGDHDGRIKYTHIPRVQGVLTPELLRSVPEKFVSDYIEGHKGHVLDAMSKIVSSDAEIVGVVVDMFCTSMIDVANAFGVPSYVFFCSGAGFLGLMYHLSTLSGHVVIGSEEESELIIPSFENPVPATSLPNFAMNKEGFDAFIAHARRFKETKGIFVNTFFELEPHAVQSLVHVGGAPSVYTVGPLLDLSSLVKKSKKSDDEDQGDEVMKWLDKQSPSSVVLLCFGSMGTFDDPTQLTQIAWGLERSGHKFLWSVRRPPPKGKFEPPSTYTNYDEILPSGFLERIGDRGMLCGWIPQVEVLSHNAIGGFVSHCGWNSILESVWFGIPIAAWPLYAEQQTNAFQIVRDLGVAVEVKLDYRKGCKNVVMADDIERAVTRLMDGESEARKRAKEMGEKGRNVVMEGGSSFISFDRLVATMLENVS